MPSSWCSKRPETARPQPSAATDAVAQQIDELQFVVGEGPCPAAYLDDCPYLWPDLGNVPAAARWPAFVPDALAVGVCAAFAFRRGAAPAGRCGIFIAGLSAA
jgi:hypothetical protein